MTAFAITASVYHLILLFSCINGRHPLRDNGIFLR